MVVWIIVTVVGIAVLPGRLLTLVKIPIGRRPTANKRKILVAPMVVAPMRVAVVKKFEKEESVMTLFKKKEKTASCCCEGTCDQQTMAAAEASKNKTEGIKILGSGCAKCNQLEAATEEALKQLGMADAIEHVTDFAQIASYGVMTTPALVVDGKVVSYGKVLKTEEVVKILEKV
jgi:small redox-active disulfide protein 2